MIQIHIQSIKMSREENYWWAVQPIFILSLEFLSALPTDYQRSIDFCKQMIGTFVSLITLTRAVYTRGTLYIMWLFIAVERSQSGGKKDLVLAKKIK